jgi:hypothetical protein
MSNRGVCRLGFHDYAFVAAAAVLALVTYEISTHFQGVALVLALVVWSVVVFLLGSLFRRWAR